MDPNQQPQPNQTPEPIPGSIPPAPQAPAPQPQPQPLPQPSVVPQPMEQPQPQLQPTETQVQPQPQPEPYQQPQAHHFFGTEQSAVPPSQPQPQPSAPTFAATPTTPSTPSRNPGANFGIASLILCLVGLGLFGLIFGILGLKKSRRAGMKNPLALVGIILGSIEIVVGIVAIVLLSSWLSLVFNTCQELGTGTHVQTDGRSVTCNV